MEIFEIQQGILVKYHGSDPYVELPGEVRIIGEGAFRDHRDLREVTIPSSVTEIRAEAFRLCVNLEKIIGADAVVSIGLDAFSGTPWYKYYSENEVDWKEDFLFVGKVLVKARRNLRKARIPEGTVMIAADAFYERVLLSELELPESVTCLGWRAFKGCTGLTAVHIPGSVKTVGWHCFDGCSRLVSVEISEGVEVLENGVFSSCRGLRRITFPKSLRSLGGWMFFSCTYLREVSFLGPVREIGERAFSGCYELLHVKLPSGLERIGVEAFYECTNLREVVLPDGVKRIGRQAFMGDRYFSELVLPKSLEQMEESVFHDCLGINRLVLPGFMKELPRSSFYNCRGLQTLMIEDGVETIGDYAFGRCTKLTEVVLPPSAMHLGEGALEGCRMLQTVLLPEGMQSLGRECFAGCTELTKLTLPGSLTRIGGKAFERCFGLADERGFLIQDHRFYAYLGEKTELELPSEVTEVASGAFAENTRYRKLLIPEQVCRIGDGTFVNCENLEELRILSGEVSDLGEDPFGGCRALRLAVICGMTPEEFESPAVQTAVALGYCEAYQSFSGEKAERYGRYIESRKAYLMQTAVDNQFLLSMKYFTDQDRMNTEEFNDILEYAQKKKAMEIVALLLEYRNRHEEMELFDKYGL